MKLNRRAFVKVAGVSIASAYLGCRASAQSATTTESTGATSAPSAATHRAVAMPSVGGPKVLIAHRGASAYAPENTLPAYELAMKQGADFVEQDLQISKDGVLVCCHDIDLTRVSDVVTRFPDRFTEVTEKGKPVKRWWIHSFTVDELKTLDFGAHKDAKFGGTRIPTWQEAIDLIRGRAGLFPETKAPEMYGKFGFNMEQMVVDQLNKNGLNDPKNDATPVFFQSFSRASLERLNNLVAMRWPKLQLSNAGKPLGADAMAEVPAYATAVGPFKRDITPAYVEHAHALKLSVVPYTFQSDDVMGFDSVADEMRHYLFDLGVDALFTNNPDQFPRSAK